MLPSTDDASSATCVEPKKIVIFYSSIGNGHISAAKAIRRALLDRQIGAQVVLKDIRSFMNPAWRELDERLYWFIATNLPECFDALFLSFKRRGNQTATLSDLPNDYPEDQVAHYLQALAPDAILATHYGAAQVLGTLRGRGLLSSTRIGWLHTDYFEGYFPRISKRIDRTFLAHPDLEARWLAAGVPPDKVVTSGMPVDVPTLERSVLRRGLRDMGLATDMVTLLITTGREGLGDAVTAIDSILHACATPIQIIVVCGANTACRAQLVERAQHLPDHTTVVALGLVPHDQMVALIGAVDVLITKAGGLTPSEAFALGTPTVLLDVIGGHERENAEMFTRSGMAVRASDPTTIGNVVRDLLESPPKLDAMLEAQSTFRRNMRIDEIVRFAFDDRFTPIELPFDFGAEDGTPVDDVDEALARLDVAAPADIELLLSYSTARSPQRVVLENPFGHIAIRLGAVVYSANHIAKPTSDPNFLQHLDLSDYLYGTVRPSSSQVHTNTYGMAYGRETLGLRVAGVDANRLEAMRSEVIRIEDEYRRGVLHWDRSRFNCADVVGRILARAGWDDRTRGARVGFPAMPLDVFEAARTVFTADPSLRIDLVAYRQVPGAKASYRFSRFPLSFVQPLRSIANILRDRANDPLESTVHHQVGSVRGDRRLTVDILRSPASDSKRQEQTRDETTIERAFLADLQRLISVHLDALSFNFELRSPSRLDDEFRKLVEGAQELLERAVAQIDAIGSPNARRLREMCDVILSIQLRSRVLDVQTIESARSSARFRAFRSRIRQTFEGFAASPTWRARVWSRALRWRVSRLAALDTWIGGTDEAD